MTLSIGVIVCSTRTPRVCPQIASWVIDILKPTSPDTSTTINSSPSPSFSLSLIDLAAWNFPFFNEPGIPQQIKHHSEYIHEHTRSWSLEIQKHSAFIFVTPQYNWGYPASIKNAIDYLFNEWGRKPAMIVSYGGHGGGKAAEQLKQVLGAVGMLVSEREVGLRFESKASIGRTQKGLEIEETGEGGKWEVHRDDVRVAFKQMMDVLEGGKI